MKGTYKLISVGGVHGTVSGINPDKVVPDTN